MKSSGSTIASWWQRARALARPWALALGAVGAFALAGCEGNPFNTADREIILGVGTPQAAPGQIGIDAGATQATAPIEFDVDVGVDLKVNQGQGFPLAVLGLGFGNVPSGLAFTITQPDNESEAASGRRYNHLFGNGAEGPQRFRVQLRVNSATPIGTVSPGRHVIELRAFLCLTFEPDDANSTGIPCGRANGRLVLVIGGAPAPGSPVALAAVPTTTTVGLTWAPDPAPDSYLLERALTGSAFMPVGTLSAPVSSYDDSGLTSATAYTYRLTPRNAAGTGPAATIDVVTLAQGTGNGNVSVAVTGEGVGRVSSVPAGIDCPGDCSETLPLGSNVVLVATPAVGSVFTSWSGPADCADGQVTVVAEIACVAVFARAPGGARGWRELGGALFNSAEAPVIAADPVGPIYAATRRIAGTYRELIVQRFNGTGWDALGGAPLNAAPDAAVGWHDLAIDRDGAPLAAWSETLGRVIVARFANDAWTRMATDLRVNNTNLPGSVQIAVRDLAVAVAWIEFESGTPRLALKRWTGTQWIGGYTIDVPNATGLRLALDANGLATLVVSRAITGTVQPLRVISETAVGVWQQVGADITVAAGLGFQHDIFGYGLGFTRLGNGLPGMPVVMGTRQNLYVYARGFDGTAWTTTNPVFNGAPNPDGLILDASPNTSDPIGGAAMLRMPAGLGVAILRAPSGSANPRRVEVLQPQGADWVAWTDPLVIPRAASSLHASVGADGQPIVVLLEAAGSGAPTMARAYRWVP